MCQIGLQEATAVVPVFSLAFNLVGFAYRKLCVEEGKCCAAKTNGVFWL